MNMLLKEYYKCFVCNMFVKKAVNDFLFTFASYSILSSIFADNETTIIPFLTACYAPCLVPVEAGVGGCRPAKTVGHCITFR